MLSVRHARESVLPAGRPLHCLIASWARGTSAVCNKWSCNSKRNALLMSLQRRLGGRGLC